MVRPVSLMTDHLACEVHPHSGRRRHIGGRSLVKVTEALQVVTDVTMVGLLIRFQYECRGQKDAECEKVFHVCWYRFLETEICLKIQI